MPISKPMFEIGYKKVEVAFGMRHNVRRMDIYFGELEELLEEGAWIKIVKNIIRCQLIFPKVPELIGMVYESNKSTYSGTSDDDWINDDCTVKECFGGLIHIDVEGYITAWRCPECNRWPNNKIPPRYNGLVKLRNKEEMAERRQERIYISRRKQIHSIADQIIPPNFFNILPLKRP